jgi:hypothetical protein
MTRNSAVAITGALAAAAGIALTAIQMTKHASVPTFALCGFVLCGAIDAAALAICARWFRDMRKGTKPAKRNPEQGDDAA